MIQTPPAVHAAPAVPQERLLDPQPQHHPLYQALNLPLLSRPALLAEALSAVGFAGLPPQARQAVLPFLEANWEALCRDGACLEALRGAAFVQTGLWDRLGMVLALRCCAKK
jgi:hypothetical protein